jgi:hypothetical protein
MVNFVVTATTFQDGRKANTRSMPALNYEDAKNLALSLQNTAFENIERNVEIGVSVPLLSTTAIVPVTALDSLIERLTNINEQITMHNPPRKLGR